MTTAKLGNPAHQPGLNPEDVIELRAWCRRVATPIEIFAQHYSVSTGTIIRALKGLGTYTDGLALSHREYKESRRKFNSQQAATFRQRFRTGEISVKNLSLENDVDPGLMRQLLSCQGAYASDNDPVDKALFIKVRQQACREEYLNRDPAQRTTYPASLSDEQVEQAREIYLRDHPTMTHLASTFNVTGVTMRDAITAQGAYAHKWAPLAITPYPRTPKLSLQQTADIRHSHAAKTHTMAQLAAEFDVSVITIRSVIRYAGAYAADTTNKINPHSP